MNSVANNFDSPLANRLYLSREIPNSFAVSSLVFPELTLIASIVNLSIIFPFLSYYLGQFLYYRTFFKNSIVFYYILGFYARF